MSPNASSPAPLRGRGLTPITPTLVSVLAAAGIIAAASVFADPVDLSGDPVWFTPEPPRILVGPVAGLTTGWHLAPDHTGIPVGTVALVRVAVPAGGAATWTGASAVNQERGVSTAVCPIAKTGLHEITVTVESAAGSAVDTLMFDGIDVKTSEVSVTDFAVQTGSLEIDTTLPPKLLNPITVGHFFGPSIAALRETGPDAFRTSVNRPVPVQATMSHPDLAPLLEWRVDGEPVSIGTRAAPAFDAAGLYAVTFGPPDASASIVVETYAVTITDVSSGDGSMPEGEPIMFIATTDPPGFENEVTWLAATKYGTATPVLGSGPFFVCEFNDTFGFDPDIGLWQWMGVKADSAAAGQDQKACDAVPYDGGLHEIASIDPAQPMMVFELMPDAAAALTIVALDDGGDIIEDSAIEVAPGVAIGINQVFASAYAAMSPNIPGASPALLCGASTEVLDATYVGECGDNEVQRYTGNANGVLIVSVDATDSDCPVDAEVKNIDGDVLADLRAETDECTVAVHHESAVQRYTVYTDCDGVEGACKAKVNVRRVKLPTEATFTLLDKTFTKQCVATWFEVVDTTGGGVYNYVVENTGECNVEFQIVAANGTTHNLAPGAMQAGNHQNPAGTRISVRYRCVGEAEEDCAVKIRITYEPEAAGGGDD